MNYRGDRTTGFASPASDAVEDTIDLMNEVLDLRRPSRYPVRVDGQGLNHRGIHDGDLLVVDAALSPSPGCLVIASIDDDAKVCEFTHQANRAGVLVSSDAGREFLPLDDDADRSIWAVVCGLVRHSV